MGERSTAVKRFVEYEIVHVGGAVTKVRETLYVDPSDPGTLHVARDVQPPMPLKFIAINVHLVSVKEDTK